MYFEKLKALLNNSYAPYSNFKVAAIAVSNDKKEYYGVNVENAAYPSGLCAERSALFGSVAYGGKVGEFREIHIISQSEKSLSPCGACRQVMSEFMNSNAEVFQYSFDGKIIRKNKVSELIPFPVKTEDIS